MICAALIPSLHLNTIFLTVFVFYRLVKGHSATVIYPRQWRRWDIQMSVASRKLCCLQHTGTKWYISQTKKYWNRKSICLQNTDGKPKHHYKKNPNNRLTRVKMNKPLTTSEFKAYPWIQYKLQNWNLWGDWGKTSSNEVKKNINFEPFWQ